MKDHPPNPDRDKQWLGVYILAVIGLLFLHKHGQKQQHADALGAAVLAPPSAHALAQIVGDLEVPRGGRLVLFCFWFGLVFSPPPRRGNGTPARRRRAQERCRRARGRTRRRACSVVGARRRL